MRRIRRATFDEWRGVAEQAKKCRRELFLLQEIAGPFVALSVSDLLILRAIKQLDKFGSRAEDEMSRQGYDTGGLFADRGTPGAVSAEKGSPQGP